MRNLLPSLSFAHVVHLFLSFFLSSSFPYEILHQSPAPSQSLATSHDLMTIVVDLGTKIRSHHTIRYLPAVQLISAC